MKCADFSRYLSLLAISVAPVWTTALTAQESADKGQETKNNAVVPEPRADQKGWMDRHEAINARVKQDNVDLMFIGDSISEVREGAGRCCPPDALCPPTQCSFTNGRHDVRAIGIIRL